MAKAQTFHRLIIGGSGSGKTHLARHLAALDGFAGRKVLVYSPFKRDWTGTADRCTSSMDELEAWTAKARHCHVAVDETSAMNHADRLILRRIATTCRHQGHRLTAIGHAATRAIEPMVRAQAGEVFLFGIGGRSAAALEDDIGVDVSAAITLPIRQFFWVRERQVRGPYVVTVRGIELASSSLAS